MAARVVSKEASWRGSPDGPGAARKWCNQASNLGSFYMPVKTAIICCVSTGPTDYLFDSVPLLVWGSFCTVTINHYWIQPSFTECFL